MRTRTQFFIAFSIILLFEIIALSANSKESLKSIDLPNHGRVQYVEVLPDAYDSSAHYPIILGFSGDGQAKHSARWFVRTFLKREAEKRGYIVVSPIADRQSGFLQNDGYNRFFEGGAVIFPEFLEAINERYNGVKGNMHIMGLSNGGLSSVHIAAQYPEYFSTMTVWPGYLRPPTNGTYENLRNLCLTYWAGEYDTGWVHGTRVDLSHLDQLEIKYEARIFKGEGHVIRQLTGSGAQRIFNRLENCN